MGTVGPWNLIEPRAAWVTVILIAGIGFMNYILWKLYGARGVVFLGFLGGLVNSNFTVIELSSRVQPSSSAFVESAYRGILLATTAMVMRNACLLLILAPLALVGSLAAFVLMLLTSTVLVLWSYRRRDRRSGEEAPQIKLELPFSLPLALKYGAVFLLLHIVGAVTAAPIRQHGVLLRQHHRRPDVQRERSSRCGYAGLARQHIADRCGHRCRSCILHEHRVQSIVRATQTQPRFNWSAGLRNGMRGRRGDYWHAGLGYRPSLHVALDSATLREAG